MPIARPGRTWQRRFRHRQAPQAPSGLAPSPYGFYRASTFEGQPAGTAVTAANSASGSGEAFQSVILNGTATVAYSTAQAAHGTNSALLTVPASSSAFVRWEGLKRPDQYGRGYFLFPSLPAGTVTFVQFTVQNVAQVAFIRADSAGHIIISDPNGSNTGTSAATVTAGQWFRLDWHVGPNGQAQVRLFLSPDSAAPTETLTATGGSAGSPDMVQFMCGDVFAYHMDCLLADAGTWPGPWQRPVGMQIPAQHPYIIGEDWGTVTAARPWRYFTAAAQYGIGLCRVFVAFDQIFTAWLANPAPVLNAIQRMCDDADSQGVKLILSPLLNRNAIGVLGGTTYATDSDAAVALTTPGSAPQTQLLAWQAALAGRVGGHNGVFSFEAGNELDYLELYVSTATYLTFLDTFQANLKTSGAKAVNGGGKVSETFGSYTDANILTYTGHLDYLDNHIYPNDISTSPAAEAVAWIDYYAPFIERIRTLTGKPGYPVLYGEIGTLPDAWYKAAFEYASANKGYMPCAWVFDGDPGDLYGFNDTTLRTGVLPWLQTVPGLPPLGFAALAGAGQVTAAVTQDAGTATSLAGAGQVTAAVTQDAGTATSLAGAGAVSATATVIAPAVPAYAAPGQTWQRRFRHRQQQTARPLLPVTVTNSLDGSGAASGTTLTQGAGGNTGGGGDSFFDIISAGTGVVVQFDSAHAAHGSLSCQVATGTTSAQAYAAWSASAGTQTQVWFRQYLYFTAIPAANTRVLTVLAASNAALIQVNATTGVLRMQDSANAVMLTTASAIPAGQWFRIEGQVTASNTGGQGELKLFLSPDSTAADETQTSAAAFNTLTSFTTYRFGVGVNTVSAGPYWQDDLGLSNTGYIGPVTGGATPGTAAPAGASAVTAAVTQDAGTATSLAGAGQATAAVTEAAPAVLAAAGAVSATGIIVVPGTANLAGAAAVTDAATQAVTASPAGSGAVTAAVSQAATAAPQAAGQVTAAVTQDAGTATSLAGAGQVTAVAAVTAPPVPAYAQPGPAWERRFRHRQQAPTATPATPPVIQQAVAYLTAASQVGSSVYDSVYGAAYGGAPVTQAAAASLAGAGAVTATATVFAGNTATVTAAGQVTANAAQAAAAAPAGAGQVTGAVTQAVTAAPQAAGQVTGTAAQACTAALAGAGAVSANANVLAAGNTATITAAAAVTAKTTQAVTAAPAGAGAVNASGVITGTASIAAAAAVSTATAQAASVTAAATAAVTGTAAQAAPAAITATGAVSNTSAQAATASPQGAGTVTARTTQAVTATAAAAGAVTTATAQSAGAAAQAAGSVTAAGAITGTASIAAAGAVSARTVQAAPVTAAAAGTLAALAAQQAAAALAAGGAISAGSSVQVAFTVGTLTAVTAPAAVLTAADAPGGTGGVLTAADTRTGGPG